MKLHLGTLFAGVIYLIIGVMFLFESLGWWSFRWADFRLLGPLALVAIGLAVLAGSLGRRNTTA